jgi:hypothetical protein
MEPDTFEKILAQINARLTSIDRSLDHINGRLTDVEKLATFSDKAIAVLIAENKLVDLAQSGVNKRLEVNQQRTDDRIYEFFKKNGLQLTELAALIAMFGKLSGWW